MSDNPTPAAVEATAEPKPRNSFDSAAKVVRAVQLHAVRFGSFSAHSFDAADSMTDDDTVSVTTKFLRPTVEIGEGTFSTKTTLLFQMGRKLQDAEDANAVKAYAVIQATLTASYGLKPDAPKFSEEDLADYALCYCPFHVWGYWREFVQSSLARLDLPQVTVPLFLINQAPEMVRDKFD